jgi:DNA mismatch repair protein MutL
VSLKIAAGEVIEGPFSVVRELLDNAIDAESTQIRVSISNGGRDFIQVTDNGTGMSVQDAKLSVLKHTTSKIASIDDLNRITSMGFRGEALSSICAVSDFTMVTMDDTAGIRIHVVYGGEAAAEPVAANPGTSVTVRNLFQNLPARKKFLKSNRSEAARIRDEVLKKAISFHRCGFIYKNDDRVVLTLPPREHVADRLRDVYGDSFGDDLIETGFKDDELELYGFISNIRHTLSNRGGQYIFINNRPVTDRSLLFALNSPCKGIVQNGRYPYAFLFIHVDPKYLDINVHPAKKEVKIMASDRMYSAVYHAVDDALHRAYYGASARDGGAIPGADGPMPGYEPPRVSETAAEGQFSLLRESPLDRHVSAGLYEEGEESLKGEPRRIEELGSHESALFNIHMDEIQYRGSIFNTFLIFEHGSGVIVMDQHAAHERVYYEQFGTMYRNGTAVKSLLVPINFTPPAAAHEDLVSSLEVFAKAGISIEPFGDESFNILTLPAFIPEKQEEAAVSGLFDELYAGKRGFTVEQIRDTFIKLAACRSAVKEGDALSKDEALALMRDVLGTRIPFACPHGRPTMVVYSREYFDRQFKRR